MLERQLLVVSLSTLSTFTSPARESHDRFAVDEAFQNGQTDVKT